MDSEELNLSPFNSELEYAIRVAILLSEIKHPMTMERLIAYDFIAVYPMVFHINGKNIHGDNLLKFSEFSVRRMFIERGLIMLLRKGLIRMSFDISGYRYSITDAGMDYAGSIMNSYVSELRKNITLIEKRFCKVTDSTLIKRINTLAVRTMEN